MNIYFKSTNQTKATEHCQVYKLKTDAYTIHVSKNHITPEISMSLELKCNIMVLIVWRVVNRV